MGEEMGGILHRHMQHIGDGFVLIAHFQRFAVVALAFAHLAFHIDIGQEMHLDFGDAIALTGFATPALDVEGKPPGFISACFGFR